MIIINTRKSLSATVRFIGAWSGKFVYHFICGYGYLKAFVERGLGTVSRRLDRFAKRFRNLDAARNFVRSFFVYYNWFRKHRTLGHKPAEFVFGVSLRDPWEIIKLLLSSKIMCFSLSTVLAIQYLVVYICICMD